ncbi:MAG TPA: hypothetical protein VK972_02060, partial [Wenzhouxiangella sp.]|nr:hypothetical protein [Wenzhouxiangella sp.]
VLATRLSELLGKLRAGTAERLAHLLENLKLPTALPGDVDRDQLLALMRLDKKNRADRIRVVLLEELGRATVEPCPADDIREALERS